MTPLRTIASAVALFRAPVLALASQRLSLTTWYRVDDLPPAEGVIDPGGRAEDPREDFVALRLPVAPGAELTAFDVTTGEPVRTEAVLDGPLLSGIQLRGDSMFVARIAPKGVPPPRRAR